MISLCEVPTPSQPDFPTGRALVFFICQSKTGIRLMIDFLIVMGSKCWVPLTLCCPIASPFIEAVGLSLEILIFIG